MTFKYTHETIWLIFSCYFKGQPCDQKDWKTTESDFGVCYTFNANNSATKNTNIQGNLQFTLKIYQMTSIGCKTSSQMQQHETLCIILWYFDK